MPKQSHFLVAFGACALGLSSWVQAGTDVATVTYSATSGTPTTSEGFTYDNSVEAVTDFSDVGGGAYTVLSSAPNALAQRNGTPNQSSIWYVINGAGPDYSGVHQDAYGALLKSNNLFEGSDNTFSNGTAASSGNIERIDFTWNTPFTNLNSLAFAVFDRGVAGAHDSFTIAIVTGVAADGTPTAYGGFLKVARGWGGAVNPVATQNYALLRYGNGDDITAHTATSNGSQGIGGIVFKSSEFNLPAGTQVYGYSLMGSDVNPTTASDLLNVANTAVYPAGTTDTDGGIDLAAVNGLEIREVPEPTVAAGIAAGFVLAAAVCVSRRRTRRLATRANGV